MAKTTEKSTSKVFIIQNSDGLILGVVGTDNRAETLKKIGRKRWNEKWKATPYTVNDIEPWVLEGDELYKQVSRR